MAASIASIFSKHTIVLRAGLALAVAATFCVSVGAQRRPRDPRKEEERETRRPVARPNPPRLPGADLFFCTTNDVQCRTEVNQFAIAEVRDLFIFAAWRNLSGEHTQQLRFVLPDGNTYQTVATKFTVEARASDAEVQVAVRSRDEKAVSTPLAVAGTHITQHSLSGSWIVEVYLDGKFIARRNLILSPRDPQ